MSLQTEIERLRSGLAADEEKALRMAIRNKIGPFEDHEIAPERGLRIVQRDGSIIYEFDGTPILYLGPVDVVSEVTGGSMVFRGTREVRFL